MYTPANPSLFKNIINFIISFKRRLVVKNKFTYHI